MASTAPQVAGGSGAHPVVLVVVSSHDLGLSCTFYSQVFGWPLMKMSSELAVCPTAAGPAIAVRSGVPEGFPAAVPFLSVKDVPSTLASIVAAGGSEERAPWTLPGLGTLARFADPSGTLYGLTDATFPSAVARMPVPFGDAPKPPAGALCSLEMFARDGEGAGKWFAEWFGWGAAPTMPHFVMFDPGAGISGVFQSHSPANTSMVYVYAESVSAKLADIETAGGHRVGEPMSMPGMATFGYFREPSGTLVGLIGG